MNSVELYHKVAQQTSAMVTKEYSTSFSLGIRFLQKKYRNPIYAIYGFVRLGDEIVDTFHEYDKKVLLNLFKRDVNQALKDKISLNPILHNFQQIVHDYKIDKELINTFISSMEMDLHRTTYTQDGYKNYIFGSAEAVGLMCLKIFCDGDSVHYEKLKAEARRLGSAYQKVNFLRDLNHDYQELGRSYFPGIDIQSFNQQVKHDLIKDIKADFNKSYEGIKKLPKQVKLGVYLSFIYYSGLLKKIDRTKATKLLEQRIRLSNFYKYMLFIYAGFKYKLNLI